MTNQTLFESVPRWHTAPLICERTNLPAFKSKVEAAAYRDEHCPHCVVLNEWLCKECNHFHFWSGAPTDSSGGRLAGSDQIPERIAKLIRETQK